MSDFEDLPEHIAQSKPWGDFKTALGNKAITVKNVQFTLHKMPVLNKNIGYCLRVDPENIDWRVLRETAKENNCSVIRFDCPNIIKRKLDPKETNEDKEERRQLTSQEKLFLQSCVKSPRNSFAKKTVLIDISPSKDQILTNMKSKTRYNIRYARRKGIRVKNESNKEGLEKFIYLQRQTATREDFFVHPDNYYRTLWKYLAPKEMAHIMIAYHEDDPEPLTANMFFTYNQILYYPYGGTSLKKRNLQHSARTMWKGICLGKKYDCTIFDMWGATDNKNDDWWGFTRFKLGFGGDIYEFIDSYDLVINPAVYKIFNLGYQTFWKLVSFKRKLRHKLT
ncbi:MAG: lipid II:glycine glycyltransferase FemX [Patescibacteria group bacterium]